MSSQGVESYSVGIDLGTTNAVIAYVPIAKGKALQAPAILPVGQWVAEGVWQEKPLFPACRYHVRPHEAGLLQPLPFPFRPLSKDFPVIYGEYALQLSAINRGQSVVSAKSWLSQAAQVHQNPHDAFLPWGTDRDSAKAVPLVSPVMASASYLHYLHAWWNNCFPDFPLNEQQLVITLPASFDEYARDLTLAAAELAGLPQAQFLEEPTAAAYAWFTEASEQDNAAAMGLMCVLDVGGGTTDLSLIDFHDPAQPKRLAVGQHLMLGGDNLDAAIAQAGLTAMQSQTEQKIQLSFAQWSQLTLAARQSKELLLSENPPETVSLSLVGRGKSLIGQQRQANLPADELRQTLLNGFLPLLDYDTSYTEPAKSGLVHTGLQFENNPAISAHLLKFLQENDHVVHSVLLNGGLFEADSFRERIQTQFKQWSEQHWQQQPVRFLQPKNPQLAVALGAVIYAELRRQQTRQGLIGGGAPRSLFLELESDQHAEHSTMARAVCVAVKGMEEAKPQELSQKFRLAVNQPVQFKLYSTGKNVLTSDHLAIQVGDLVTIDAVWSQLPPLQATIETQQPSEDDLKENSMVDVYLSSEITTFGSLQLQFKSAVKDLKLPNTVLEFAGRSSSVGIRLHRERLPQHWPQIEAAFAAVYGPKQGQQNEKENIAGLRKCLDTLGSKSDWDVHICRFMADILLKWHKNRRRSAKHESLWLTLLGIALRPGFGVIGDTNRMNYVRHIVNTPPGHQEQSVWSAWWTLVRRCAAGLDLQTQLNILNDPQMKVDMVIDYLRQEVKKTSQKAKVKSREKKPPKKIAKQQLSKKEVDLKNRAPESMLPAIASFEKCRLPGGHNNFDLADKLFALLHVDALGVNNHVLGWSYGQLVNRFPYQVDDGIEPLPVSQVQAQLEIWLTCDWQQYPELGLAASFAVQMTGDEREVDETLRLAVEEKLITSKLEQWRKSIRQQQSNSLQDTLAGESLPHGLAIK